MTQPQPSSQPARLLLCFDFEGAYGMPHNVRYDLASSSALILEMLAAYQVRAIFFIVGRMVEEAPEIVQRVADAGHEIGLHGYDHDDMASYSRPQLAAFASNLDRVESLLQEMTGTRPRCFRAPYLLAPRFYRPEVYAILRAHGYRWVSNREVRYPAELLRPDRFPMRRARHTGSRGALAHLDGSRIGITMLNPGIVCRETFGGSVFRRLVWLTGSRAPFLRDGLLEVPVYTPLDCDLVGLPRPSQDTPPELLAYAEGVLRVATIARRPLTMATFHDWIVGSGNRLVLLKSVLDAALGSGIEVSTVVAQENGKIIAR